MKVFDETKRALIGLSLGHFTLDLYAAILTPLFPLITLKLNINLALIGTIIAFCHLVSSMMQPVFGFFADKMRHRFFMVWGLILSSVFIPLTLRSQNVLIFTLFLMLGMVGNALFHPQVSALVRDFNKKNPDLSRAMGVFLGLGTIGYAIGPYISTYIVENFGEKNFIYIGIIGLLTCIFIYFFVPKMKNREKINNANFLFIIKEILKNKTCVFLTFIAVVKSAVSVSFGTYIPFLLQKQGYSLSQIGLIVTLFFVSGGLATIFSSKIEKRLTANGVIVLSFVSIAPLTALFLLTFRYFKYFSILLFILTGFFILLSVGVILVQAQKQMPEYTGVISGVMQGFSWGIGALFLSPLGFVGQYFGVDKILILMAVFAFFVGLYTLKNKCLED